MVISTKTIVSNAPFSEDIPGLLQSHLDHLKESGISTEVIKQRGYESVVGHKRLKDLGFGRQQCRTPGMLIPLWGVDGIDIVGYQFRPDNPRLNTNLKIPIILPDDYYSRMQKLRNELALFTLHHFKEVDASRMIIFDDMDIEPRLKQLVMPISIVYQLRPDGERTFREYLLKRQQEIRRVRSMSWEGSLVNLVYSIASGHADLGEEFAGYCDEAGQVQVVTPTMVARLMKSSAKMVTQTLAGVGFEVEWRRVNFKRDGQRFPKPVRAYCIPDSQTWAEVTSRYYYSEDGEMTEAIPDVLKSHKFHRVPGSVASVTSVTNPLQVEGHVTVATDATHYFTRHGNNGNKPTDPCAACGAIDWRRRDGDWLCGHCHPEPRGEFMFKLDRQGNG